MFEFFIEGQGDAALHEAILEAGDHAAAEASSVAVLIRNGFTAAQIAALGL